MAPHRQRAQILPPWTADGLSQSCKTSLTLIVTAIYLANKSLHPYAKSNWDYFHHEVKRKNRAERWWQCHFEEEDAEVLKKSTESAIQAVETPDHDLKNVFSVLADTTYLHLWKNGVNCISDLSQGHGGQESYDGKVLSADILQQRDIAARELDKVDDELRARKLDDVSDAIFDKVKVLEMFANPYNYAKGFDEPSYEIYLPKGKKVKRVVDPDPDQPKSLPSTLIAVVCLTILAAFVPMGIAWKLSSSTKGSTKDADFYLLIQSSAMNILGIFTAVYPTWNWPASHAKRWAYTFTVLGIVCATVSILVYLYVSMIWSGLLSFSAAAIQAFMVLQFAIASLPIKSRLKVD